MDNLHLPPAKLDIYGKGESRPMHRTGVKGRALNRRVEVSIRAYKLTQEIRQGQVRNNSGVLKTESNGPLPASG